jgi:hypothetical protein
LTGLQKFMTHEDKLKLGLIDEHGNLRTAALNFKSIEQGASTSVWAAVADELDGVGGFYLEDCSIAKLTTIEAIFKERRGYVDYALNKENAIKLWDLSMQWAEKPPK